MAEKIIKPNEHVCKLLSEVVMAIKNRPNRPTHEYVGDILSIYALAIEHKEIEINE